MPHFDADAALRAMERPYFTVPPRRPGWKPHRFVGGFLSLEQWARLQDRVQRYGAGQLAPHELSTLIRDMTDALFGTPPWWAPWRKWAALEMRRLPLNLQIEALNASIRSQTEAMMTLATPARETTNPPPASTTAQPTEAPPVASSTSPAGAPASASPRRRPRPCRYRRAERDDADNPRIADETFPWAYVSARFVRFYGAAEYCDPRGWPTSVGVIPWQRFVVMIDAVDHVEAVEQRFAVQAVQAV